MLTRLGMYLTLLTVALSYATALLVYHGVTLLCHVSRKHHNNRWTLEG